MDESIAHSSTRVTSRAIRSWYQTNIVVLLAQLLFRGFAIHVLIPCDVLFHPTPPAHFFQKNHSVGFSTSVAGIFFGGYLLDQHTFKYTNTVLRISTVHQVDGAPATVADRVPYSYRTREPFLSSSVTSSYMLARLCIQKIQHVQFRAMRASCFGSVTLSNFVEPLQPLVIESFFKTFGCQNSSIEHKEHSQRNNSQDPFATAIFTTCPWAAGLKEDWLAFHNIRDSGGLCLVHIWVLAFNTVPYTDTNRKRCSQIVHFHTSGLYSQRGLWQ